MEKPTQPHGPDHPDLAAEQAVVDAAYLRLDAMRAEATARARALYDQREGTHQHRYERDVAVRTALARAQDLDIGDLSLVFGRIDRVDGESFHIGRRGVFDDERHPLVIDWRVPAAEPFYRATGRHPEGLELRRHLMTDSRTVLGIEDERFSDDPDDAQLGLAGTGALVAALARARTGRMRDIVSTVQAEQDQIIRADIDGVLAVQGGPGTGKTAVALHRAAYLMFTHRRKLSRQGILIVGPNRLFMRYIEQVLPALGESGATLSTVAGLVEDVQVTATEPHAVARLKGKPTMRKLIARAISDRQRPLSHDVVVRIDRHDVVLRARETRGLIAKAKRNRRPHNLRRVMLRNILITRLSTTYLQMADDASDPMPLTRGETKQVLRAHPALRKALDQMWPELTPAALLRDLYGDRELLTSAGSGILRSRERRLLERPRDHGWTVDDIPMLDDARWRLGIIRSSAKVRSSDDADEVETYGHVVVDEVQDLSPMGLRMVARRARTGSMTVVGDLAQSVGARAPREWADILRHLPRNPGQRLAELTINYRTPVEIMDVAARVLAAATPTLYAPSAVRETGEPAEFISADDVVEQVARAARALQQRFAPGTVAILSPGAMIDRVAEGVPDAVRNGLDSPIALMTVDVAKGLEFDAVVIVEPAAMVTEHFQGLHALYVALTRATQAVAVVHREPLPEPLIAVPAPVLA